MFSFRFWVKTSLVLVYLVIVAGALVRMTGSGMGCPDWPKCFGYYIPPTSEEQLIYTEGREYKKGQVIIYNEQLWVAQERFVATSDINPAQWAPYTKHDYAVFNVYHTWTEYVNRLCGALAGLACFITAVLSFRFIQSRPSLTLLSWLVVILMGFQAWLGAIVVESVLNPIKITGHMVVALLIVAIILILLKRTPKGEISARPMGTDKLFKRLLWLNIIFSIVQIILGTQVREAVDHFVKLNDEPDMGLALVPPPVSFLIHRSFSILVIILAYMLWHRNNKLQLGYSLSKLVLLMIGLEVITGIAMSYFAFPFGMQTMHLVAASILFGLEFYMLLQYYRVGASTSKIIANSSI